MTTTKSTRSGIDPYLGIGFTEELWLLICIISTCVAIKVDAAADTPCWNCKLQSRPPPFTTTDDDDLDGKWFKVSLPPSFIETLP